MLNILIVAPEMSTGPAGPLRGALHDAGYRVAHTALDNCHPLPSILAEVFAGRPPDALLADISTAADCLPLRHIMALLHQTWGDEMPLPPRLALMAPRHLENDAWQAFVDDFLLPPYRPEEMLARLALLTFRKRHVHGADILRVEDLTLDLARASASDSAGHILPLTPREFDLLRFLAMHRGKFFARDRLLDMVWGVDFDGGERTVDVHMRRLRAKMPPRAGACLETRRGLGYGLITSD
jgi:two-component system alkaline phosphatase synthesis response regulator PhoP